jgi:ERCC4-type nuclease
MALYRHFGSLPKVRDATEEELRGVKGISAADAAAVRRHFEAAAQKKG